MSWIQIRSWLQPEIAEAFEDALLEAGAVSVTFEDAKDQPIYEPDRGTTPLWQNTRVTGLFEAGCDIPTVVFTLKRSFECETSEALPEYRIEILEDKDWSREWMDNFKPISFDRRLCICPSWCEIPDENAVNLMLDPGLAFGTGTHPTTWLCLDWLDQQSLDGLQVTDYGCGSGILGIAALLLGAARVTAVDNDPQALEATLDNLQRNGLQPSDLDCYLAGEEPEKLADIMIANILAQPLINLAPTLAAQTRPGGKIILSGVLDAQASEVTAVYEQWFNMEAPVLKEDWVRLCGTRL